MITIYGKPGCEMCQKAKDKLTALNLKFDFVDVSNWIDTGEWRRKGAVGFMVEKTLREDNGRPELPLVRIENRWFDYPEAMSEVRRAPRS